MKRAFLAFSLVLALTGCDDGPAPPQRSAVAFVDVPTSPLAQVAAWGTSDGKAVVDQAELLTDNWYIVLDGSGSMGSSACSSRRYREGRMKDAKLAVSGFITKLPPSANVGLYVFDAEANRERVPLGHGSTNRHQLADAVDRVQSGNNTPLGQSIDSGFNALKAQAIKQAGYGSYHLLIVTDGQPDSFRAMTEAVSRVIQTPVALETIGFCIAEGHPLNQPGFTEYRNAMNPSDLNKGLDAILAETDAYADDGGKR